jgi:competence protein ComGC
MCASSPSSSNGVRVKTGMALTGVRRREILRASQRVARGVTLVEVLTVVAILVTLLALSAFTYIRMSRSYKEQGAAAELDVVLRQARNSALVSNAPAFVQIDSEKKRVTPWLYKTVGMWRFEDHGGSGKTHGAYHDAMFRGGEIFNEGKIGKCARLRDGAYVDVGNDPDFDLEDGGYLEAYIRPLVYEFSGDHYIFDKAGCYSLKVRQGGYLQGEVGGVKLVENTYRIAVNRWTKVALAWDAVTMRLMVDDGVVAAGPGGKAPIGEAPLLIGHQTASLIGLVDEVRVLAATAGKSLQLPGSVTELRHSAAPWGGIYFAPDGSLDMRFHPGPVDVSVVTSNKIRTVHVSMMGQTNRLEVDSTPGEERQERERERRAADAPPPRTVEQMTAGEKAKLKLTVDETANGKKVQEESP